MKYRVLFVAVLAFMIQGCGEDKFFSDNCAVNEYLCSGTEEAPSFPLYLCRLIDKKHNVTRWERMSDWEINNRCGMTSSCSDCKDKLINNKEVCEVGTFNCDSSGNLVECQLFDSEKNLAIWVLSDVCTGDCDKCLEQIDKNCSVGDFRCSNDGELQECQRLNGSKELTKWEKSDICTMNCDACVNALHEGCPHGEIQCDADRTFICEVSGQNGSVDVWKTTDECQNACSNCDDESCKLCIDKHNAALKTCEKEDEYFSYIAQTCVAVDANYNHMHDQYENAEKAGKDCSTHSECDSDNHSEDGFCDSYIGYKCSTRCTSDEQCVDDGEFHYVCRSDGRCAPDEFVTMWKFTTDHQTTTKPKTVT
ncbi:MAG: hypothetical protein J6A01_10175, partial [Proteobacteria bacterium]|nr:hypothetical protein [Pseudomonadota bacterium]